MDDELRGTTFIPYVQSTLESFSQERANSMDAQSAVVKLSDLEDLRTKTQILIERSLERGEDGRVGVLLTIHDRLSQVIDSYQLQVSQLGEDPGIQIGDSSPQLQKEEGRDDGEKDIKENPKEEEKEEDGDEDFECPICYCDYKKRETTTLQCGHQYCDTCIRQYLSGLIAEAEVENLLCPDLDCGQTIHYGDLKRIVDQDTLQKYDRFALLACLKNDPTTRWCPNPECEMAYTGELADPENPRIVCGECGQAYCYNCKDPWHEGKSCADFQGSLKPVDKKTQRWMKRQGVQNCPHCGLPTIRTTGCRDMRCTNCKKDWEWKGEADETTLEKIAYFYPRTVKYVATSREAHEDDEGTLDEIKTNVVAGTFAAVILSPALLVTVPTLLPALVVTAGRKAKHGIQDFREWMNESDDEEPKEKKEENKEEET